MLNVVDTASQVFNVCKRTSFDKLAQEELNEKLKEIEETDGFCFTGYDFCDLDFCGVNLDSIIFHQCILSGSIFSGANLSGASFVNCLGHHAQFNGANMSRATIENSNFDHCDFAGCYMTNVSLTGSSFVRSNFTGAVLIPNVVSTDTDFSGVSMNYNDVIAFKTLSYAKNVPYSPMACPDSGSFIGWKKCRGDAIVKLLIPEDAKRSSAAGRKCRCDKAIVLEIQSKSGKKLSDDIAAYSRYNPDFVYRVGETVSEEYFCEDRWEECAPGIHFFINRQEAVEY